MLKVTRWCIAHRRRVFVAWIAVAVLTTVAASAAGRNYATNFSLPGTESQRALDLLKKEFPAQARSCWRNYRRNRVDFAAWWRMFGRGWSMCAIRAGSG